MTKNETITLKIEDAVKNKFEQICKQKYSSVSRELRIFIYKTIENEKLNNKTETD